MLMRGLLVLAGLVSLLLGLLGIFLPLLPTTPFVLLAAYCLMRSSPRLHGWLMSRPAFARPVENWRCHRAVSRVAKAHATGLLVLSLLGMGWSPMPLWGWWCVLPLFSLGLVVLWTRPEGPKL